MAEKIEKHKLSAILKADVKSYSRLNPPTPNQRKGLADLYDVTDDCYPIYEKVTWTAFL